MIIPNVVGVVSVFAGSGGRGDYADGLGTNAKFAGPLSIGIDGQDNLYVADYYFAVIRKISPEGR